MADADLIACLYPLGGFAVNTIRAETNHLRYVGPEERYNRRHRQPTPEPEERSHRDCEHLELRFSHGPQTSHGFVFGSDENSDIVLSSIPGISSHHFALSFDEKNRPIVKDLGSLCGTEVTYDKHGKGRRRDFRWIVGGFKIPTDGMPIVITLLDNLRFQVVVPRRDINSPLYRDNIDLFRRGKVDTENLFGRLNLPPETERPTGTHTPGAGAIYLRKKLGEGGFGVVTYFWNVSTGEEYALKQPSEKAIRDKDVDIRLWRREASIMRRVIHEHIVKLLDVKYDPWPKLYLVHVPGGSLRDQEDISLEECKQILGQLLSALVYLHGRDLPIVHRDIKSENILVEYRYPGGIHVKIWGLRSIKRKKRKRPLENNLWHLEICCTGNLGKEEVS